MLFHCYHCGGFVCLFVYKGHQRTEKTKLFPGYTIKKEAECCYFILFSSVN